ncbi:MAG TPA: hypothetical protein VG298_07480 [Acidimicrobiales bacterium]|nr:hypothetical protein [Acidimicrobiales bacterium]
MTTTPTAPTGLRSAQLRLLRGYAPLSVLLLAIALLTILIPSVAPEQKTVTVRERVTSAGSGTSTGTGAAAGRGAATAAGGAAGGTGGAGTTATGGTGAGSGSGAGTGVATAGGKTSACSGQALQVPGDPYSPPCISFSGSNGGVTSPGVSGQTINLTYRFATDAITTSQSVPGLSSITYNDSQADIERTVKDLVTYFNNHFQFYGRKLNVNFYNGQGSFGNELQGMGQAQATADSITAAQQLHAFADVTGQTSLLYIKALAQQKVIGLGLNFLSQATMASLAPYAWGPATDCNATVNTAIDIAAKQLANQNAAYAGGALKGQPRKFAILAPDNPDYQACVNQGLVTAKADGVTISDNLQYQLNIATATSQVDSIIAKLADDNITTVILLTDPVAPLFLTDRAAQQDYDPEWMELGTGTDLDIVGQIYDQSEWAHAFGISFNGAAVPEQASLSYQAYRTVANDTPALSIISGVYEALDELSIGIQMAGPDLTPTTFEQGMRAYPGSQPNNANAQMGTWKFPPNEFNPVQDSWLVYWDGVKTSPFNGKPGAYVVGSPRYPLDQYPRTPLTAPAGFPFAASGG